MIKTVAYPRAALVGNPSDGYFGKTIAFVFKNFSAQVELMPSEDMIIVPCTRDRLRFTGMHDLAAEISDSGYYGGTRLIKATIQVFYRYCRQQGLQLPSKNFTLQYATTIPTRLGLAGSSAIVTAAMRALMQFYNVQVPAPVLANLVLSVEKDELNIGAGLQDRVAQVYASPVLMNFDKQLMEAQGYGEYTPFDKSLLPDLYIAYRTNLSEGSEVTHNTLAARYAKGEAEVLQAVKEWIQLTEETWQRLQAGNKNIGALLNRNFDIRSAIIPISPGNMAMVQAARAAGASAKFTGSGGAIIGTYTGNKMFDDLTAALAQTGAVVIKPEIN